MILAYGTCVAVSQQGVLLCGPPGSGKSDLALRLIEEGARLVADDQTELHLFGDVLRARAPATIAGQIEIRGLGILRMPAMTEVPLALVVELVPPGEVERLPEPARWSRLGVSLPLLRLAPFEASATAKLRLALKHLVRGAAASPRSGTL
jgi:serine kinase of HPr protein (carbohydrate metabolism regulator)